MTTFDYQRYSLHLAQERLRVLDLSFANIVFDPAKHPRLAGKFTFSSGTKSVPGHNFYARPTAEGHPMNSLAHEFHVRQEFGSDLKPKGTYKITAMKPGSKTGAARSLASGLTHEKLAAKLDQLSKPEGLPKNWRP